MSPSGTIAARIRRLLADKGLAEGAASEAAGLTRSALTKVLHKLEAGSESVQLDTLKKTAAALGVDWVWLLTGVGEPGLPSNPQAFGALASWSELRSRAESEVTAPPSVWAYVEQCVPVDPHVTVAQVVDFVRLVLRHRDTSA